MKQQMLRIFKILQSTKGKLKLKNTPNNAQLMLICCAKVFLSICTVMTQTSTTSISNETQSSTNKEEKSKCLKMYKSCMKTLYYMAR